jgi:hypothetical protein
MKAHLLPCGLALVLAALASLDFRGVQATTITLDFTGIPDGTPLSANNPYGGVVNLSALSGYRYSGPQIDPEYGPIESEVWAETGIIQGGAVFVNPAPGNIIPPGGFSLKSMTSLTATFLAPVDELTFTTFGWWWRGIEYQGIDGNGVPFQGSGNTPLKVLNRSTTILDAPAGGYFTELKLSDWEANTTLGDGTVTGGGQFWLESLSVRLSDAVPEPIPLAEQGFLLLILGAAPFARRRLGWQMSSS